MSVRTAPLAIALLLVSASAVANPYRNHWPEVVVERRCTLEGENVSGVVSVQTSEAMRDPIALVGVRASVRLAPVADDVTVFVTAPLRFEGRFVSRGLGGPHALMPCLHAHASARSDVRTRAA